MEILLSSEAKVRFTVPPAITDAEYKVFQGDASGIQLGTTKSAVVADGVATANVGFPATNETGQLTVELSFTYESETYTVTKSVDVVKPLLETFEIKEIHPNATPEEIFRIESAVRHVIESYTGQTFGLHREVKRVRSNGWPIILPERLVSLFSINGIGSSGFTVHENWAIHSRTMYISSGTYYEPYITDGVIHPPSHYYRRGYYDIDGYWGYENVPAPVKEAARLLINDYACADAQYRDRYLDSMTAADWRIAFNSNAWAGTGNARADDLLEPFRIVRWMAI